MNESIVRDFEEMMSTMLRVERLFVFDTVGCRPIRPGFSKQGFSGGIRPPLQLPARSASEYKTTRKPLREVDAHLTHLLALRASS